VAEGLTDKQRLFIDHYFACGFNATEAARRAGYSQKTAYAIGHENLRKPEIKAEISRRFTEQAMTPEETIGRIGEVARGDMADFLRVDEEEITLSWSLMPVPEDDEARSILELASQQEILPTDRILRTETVKRSTARLDLLAAGQAGKLHLIKKYTLDEKGKVSIELYDALAARTTIAKHHGLLVDRVETEDVTPDKAAKMTTEELEAELKRRGLL
jgi:hypothetical protein